MNFLETIQMHCTYPGLTNSAYSEFVRENIQNSRPIPTHNTNTAILTEFLRCRQRWAHMKKCDKKKYYKMAASRKV
jgi:hypothetical protein